MPSTERIQNFGVIAPDAPKQTVSLGYGKANLANTLATYASMKVATPFVRVSAVTSGLRVGPPSTVHVGTHDMNGVLVTQQVQQPQGTVILLTASWKRGGQSLRDGGLFIRLRQGAPMYNIRARVPTGHDNICGDSFTIFAGNADIMNADELMLIGVQVNRSYVERFMDEEELEECFQIMQLARESIPRPTMTTVATPEGIQVREVAQMPNRRLIFKRRE